MDNKDKALTDIFNKIKVLVNSSGTSTDDIMETLFSIHDEYEGGMKNYRNAILADQKAEILKLRQKSRMKERDYE